MKKSYSVRLALVPGLIAVACLCWAATKPKSLSSYDPQVKALLAQMTIEDDGNSLDGTPPEQFAPEMERRGADVVGVNCSIGPAHMLETIERMAAVTRARLSAQPNAGRPRDIEGRNIYLSSPEYMASYARRFARQGVRLVGGCCGTTPEHIRQMKAAIKQVNVGKAGDARSKKTRPTQQITR